MRQRFIVEITRRENATWQGVVTWLDEGKEQNFRSALELLRLIDSTMEDTPHANWEPAVPEASE